MMPVATGLKPGANEIVSPPFKYPDASATQNKWKGGDNSPSSFSLVDRVAMRPKNQGGAAAPPCQNNNVVEIFLMTLRLAA
jgi:hypothetical protein